MESSLTIRTRRRCSDRQLEWNIGISNDDKKKASHLPCPCCESPTIDVRGDYEICLVCGWEDDPVQSDDPTFAGGANRSSLNETRRHWQKTKTKVH
ncbi:hypothetical protein LGM35_22625 [Burkholderia cenocepacia]|uniref:CPCC family cysteine-rich protein n=1 Tax=Burkholderia cenocepacia TaxID=95486 RepID=UPI001CF2CE25|nr:CPCC family cysteine-rich protein [Burkholderia cenocepacia]MCA7925297.1 hypothetical protein [Burkholderia cenocepacia]